MSMTKAAGHERKKIRKVRLAPVVPHIAKARALGITQVRTLTEYLNEKHAYAVFGRKWSKSSLHRALKIIDAGDAWTP